MRFVKLTCVALFGIVGVASAQTNTVRPMTLAECIRLAVENNFDVQFERYNPEIARFNLEGSYAYYTPAFEASYVHFSNTREGGLNQTTGQPFRSTVSESDSFSAGLVGTTPWGLRYDLSPDFAHRTGTSGSAFDFYDGQTGVSLRQPLLRDFLIDAGRRNILLAKKDVQITEFGVINQIMTTVRDVEQAYYDLIFARENIGVQQKALELAERTLADNRKRVEVGTMAPLGEKQAESQAAVSRADLLFAQGLYDQQQNTLKNLITDKYTEWHALEVQPVEKLVAVPERYDVMESWQRGLTQRLDLRQAKLELERRDINLKYLKNQIYPAIDLIGSYGQNGLDSNLGGVFEDEIRGRSPSYSAGVVFSMPLSTRGPRNAYRASKAEKEQAILRTKQLEQGIMVEIDNSIKALHTNLERVDATRKARQYAEAALEAEQKKLDVGKSTTFVVLQLQKDLTDARLAEIRAITAYNKALSQAAFSEGSTLERNQLSVK